MAKKKKDDIEFIPSKYQKQIFEYLQHNNGNMVIEAAAGSGKTSTLVQAIKLIPSDKKILFCA
jgi:superfamily II DNA or RNA helicase